VLFNSIQFLFVFLPITFAGFMLIGRKSDTLAALWLGCASLAFYAWWNVSFVALLLGSVVLNYSGGRAIAGEIALSRPVRARYILIGVITVDLLLLAYFKYAGFFSAIVDDLFRFSPGFGHVVLPLGISFFTFTQIAFLVDTYQGKAKEYRIVHYLLFVTYFPHLIAGPILHHKQMMPQFAERKIYKVNWTHIAVGTTIFVMGLSKKVLLADSFATIAAPVFSAVQHGRHAPLIEAWMGALGYTFQLYFDFSGYSDMAIGLSLLFNVRMPLNFNSPYKAVNIIDFWRRWHISLSTFLRDYLYIPLGGNRKGKVRRYINLLTTMVLGGLWHGAGWTFVIWGALHGVYLVVNHAFHALKSQLGIPEGYFGRPGKLAGLAVTFFAVVVAWVFFRSDSFATASTMLQGMFGIYGLKGATRLTPASTIVASQALMMIAAGSAICWLLPNTQQINRAFNPVCQNIEPPEAWLERLQWKLRPWWQGVAIGILSAICLLKLSPTQVSEFLYYQF
jgi:Predicted membrane protein involved in D-alanine export